MIQGNMTIKAQLARELGVSRAYITMIASGRRKPSKKLVNKLGNTFVNKVGFRVERETGLKPAATCLEGRDSTN